MPFDPDNPIELELILEHHGRDPEAIIPVLQAIQRQYQYLPEQALKYVCEHSRITPAAITGVGTFYSQFRHQPAGRHTISICVGTACHVKGAPQVYDAIRRHLGLLEDADTDATGRFTLRQVSCLGCCTLAPVVQIDGVTYGNVSPGTAGNVLTDFLNRGDETADSAIPVDLTQLQGELRIGLGACCMASGAGELEKALQSALRKHQLPVRVKRVGCVGMCHREPLLEVLPVHGEPVLYAQVAPEQVDEIMLRHFRGSSLFRRLRSRANLLLDKFYRGNDLEGLERHELHKRDPAVAAFLDGQCHLATEHCGELDPNSIDDYRRVGGFTAFQQALQERNPEGMIATIENSGLRGRGGGGYPTGAKWRCVAAAAAPRKFVICNGDEGDPGAFMDRMLLESFPYRIIEGICLAALATGAQEGILYIRAEYPLALLRVRDALKDCREANLLGRNIAGTGFNLELRIVEGAGAFVCGEETALIASLEGHRGNPRWRPPYPAQSGLHGCPTLMSNAETFALVPWILRNGASAFAAIGTPASTGTKVFALAGKTARGGLIEVPMGITIRQIIEHIGGGIAQGRSLKAVQVGGPSGGCIPASLADTPVDFEALTQVGAMMGSGGMVVLDDQDCMVDIARYFLTFTQAESCGKCTHCRIGTKRMLEIIERLCQGKGHTKDLDELEHLAKIIQQGSLCGLGKTAPNPILTTLRYFRSEYQAHVDGYCPACKCHALIAYHIDQACIGCTRCAQNCPVQAIEFNPYQQHEINLEKCIKCDTCRELCPTGAIRTGNLKDRPQYADRQATSNPPGSFTCRS